MTPTISRVKEETTVIPVVMGEDLLKATVIRERKRTGRSGLAIALLMIGLKTETGTDSSIIWDDITQALLAIKSDIDILGWFEKQRSMGLIVPDIDPSTLTPLCEQLELRIRKELTDRFEDEVTSGMSIRLRVHPEPHGSGEDESLSLDPFLYPDLYGNRARWFSYDVIKRGLDIIGSLTLLIALSPVLLMIAGIVKLTSRGPVLFRQVRIGQMMKPFMFFKFRSMYADCDHAIHRDYVTWFISSSGKAQEKEKPMFFKLTNDPRITPIGHFLSKTSFDELPQLWNVLRGECRWSVHGLRYGMSCNSTSHGIVPEFWKPSRASRGCGR